MVEAAAKEQDAGAEPIMLILIAGATAASITMPLDFAKTVLQCGSQLPVQEVSHGAVSRYHHSLTRTLIS